MNINNLVDETVGSLSLIKLKDKNNTTPVFFIKEDSKLLPSLGRTPKCVETRSKVIKTNMGLSLVVIFRFNQDNSLIYDNWFNYHIENHRKLLEELMFQQYFSFTVVDSEMNEYTSFLCENQIKKILKDYNKHLCDEDWNNEKIEEFNRLTSTDHREKIKLFNDIKYYMMNK